MDDRWVLMADTVSPKSSALEAFKQTYDLEDLPFKEGSLSSLYKDKSGKLLIKLAKSSVHNNLLQHEVLILSRFEDKKMRQFIPEVTGSLSVDHRHVTMMNYLPGYVSLTDIKRAYPAGLDIRDAAWIFRRILGQAVAASAVNVVHTAIVPDHVLVHPVKHEPIHIGWVHALDRGQRISMILDRWKVWYPAEVFDKAPVEPWIDVYMAAKTMIWLLGGDMGTNEVSSIPTDIQQFLLECLRKGKTASNALREFTSIVHKLFGKTYRQLDLGGCNG